MPPFSFLVREAVLIFQFGVLRKLAPRHCLCENWENDVLLLYSSRGSPKTASRPSQISDKGLFTLYPPQPPYIVFQ